MKHKIFKPQLEVITFNESLLNKLSGCQIEKSGTWPGNSFFGSAIHSAVKLFLSVL